MDGITTSLSKESTVRQIVFIQTENGKLNVSLDMLNIGASKRLNANLKSPYLSVCSRLSVCLESPAEKRRSAVFLRTITAVYGLLALSLAFTLL